MFICGILLFPIFKIELVSNSYDIVFFPRQCYNSKLEYLQKGLEFLVAHYKNAGVKSIAFPKLGTQNGKLSWNEVGPLIAEYLSQLDIDVYIYIAEGDREYQ